MEKVSNIMKMVIFFLKENTQKVKEMEKAKNIIKMEKLCMMVNI